MGDGPAMIIANLAVCMTGVFICACRLEHMIGHPTKRAIYLTYATLVPAFVSSALSWTYDGPPTIAQLILGGVVVAQLMAGMAVWRHGVPAYALERGSE